MIVWNVVFRYSKVITVSLHKMYKMGGNNVGAVNVTKINIVTSLVELLTVCKRCCVPDTKLSGLH